MVKRVRGNHSMHTVCSSTVLADGFGFVEGPRWYDGRLWFVDIPNNLVRTVDEDGHVSDVVEAPDEPSSIGWLPDGRLLVVSMTERKLMRLEPDNRLVEHADISDITTDYCNDMVVDAMGRAYVGDFGFDLFAALVAEGWEVFPKLVADPDLPTATLTRVDPDGTTAEEASGLRLPNGTAITPDGETLIVAESLGQRLTAFDIDADGTLDNHRVWAQIPGVDPDGICVDAEGAVWVAAPNATPSACLRIAEGGEICGRVETADPCHACMLGGPDRTTLYLCVNGREGSQSGRIEAVTVDVPGAGWP